LRELGLLRADEEPAPRPNKVPAWDTLGRDEQRYEARMMEIYAAMVDNLDHNVGRLLESLHETGRDRNSVIVFLSDNGAEAMVPQNATLPGLKDWIAKNFDNRLENLGHAGSYVGYGPRWAHVSNAPQRSYKGTAYEGGHKVPAFIVVPGGDQMRVDGYAHVLDLPPTLLQVAGVALPQGSYAGRPVLGMEGRPLLGAGLKPVPADPGRVASGELFGHRGVRRGEWKAVSRWLGRDGSAPWELYDLARDPGEQQDLAAGRPAELAELVRLHDAWATTNGVILPSRDAPAFGVE
jgi:arylsulfatase